MELSMRVKRAIIDRMYLRYRRATKKQKGEILTEFCVTTGYSHHYGAWVLKHWGTIVTAKLSGSLITFKVGSRIARPRTGRPKLYDEAFTRTLAELWSLFDYLCGKRLVPLIRELIDLLCSSGGFSCSPEIQQQLCSVSPATVDRLLSGERKKCIGHGDSLTRTGNLLKHQIPLRTFSEWDDAAPGFVEADLVAHNGGSSYGDFLCTLNLTDVSSGWTESIAVLNKAQKHVFSGLQALRKALPFPSCGAWTPTTDRNSSMLTWFTTAHRSISSSPVPALT